MAVGLASCKIESGCDACAIMQTVSPGTVRGYLKRAFKDNLAAVQAAMQQLANAYSPEAIGKKGYDFYVDFRCVV